MPTRRFIVTGEPAEVGFAHTPAAGSVYVDAADADAAMRKVGDWFDAVRQVREVPWDEGRSLLWWFGRAIKRIWTGENSAEPSKHLSRWWFFGAAIWLLLTLVGLWIWL